MEKYCIFAFSSRTESIRFFNLLKAAAVPAMIINLPRMLNLGCGLSVKISCAYFNAAADIYGRNAFRTFLGAYEITVGGGRGSARRIMS